MTFPLFFLSFSIVGVPFQYQSVASALVHFLLSCLTSALLGSSFYRPGSLFLFFFTPATLLTPLPPIDSFLFLFPHGQPPFFGPLRPSTFYLWHDFFESCCRSSSPLSGIREFLFYHLPPGFQPSSAFPAPHRELLF